MPILAWRFKTLNHQPQRKEFNYERKILLQVLRRDILYSPKNDKREVS